MALNEIKIVIVSIFFNLTILVSDKQIGIYEAMFFPCLELVKLQNL